MRSSHDLSDDTHSRTGELRGGTTDLAVAAGFLSLLGSGFPFLPEALAPVVASGIYVSWLILRRSRFDARRITWFDAALLAAGGFLILHQDSELPRLGGGCLLLAVASRWWRPAPAAPVAVTLGSFGPLYLTGWIFLLSSPGLFRWIRDGFYGWSRIASSAFEPLVLGPTLSGGRWILLAVSMLAARFLLAEFRPRRFGAGLGVLLAIQVIYALALARTADLVFTRLPYTLAPLGFALPAVLFTGWLVSGSGVRPRVASRARTGNAALYWGLASALLVVTLNAHFVSPRENPRVLFYGVNEGPILKWTRPVYGAYGATSLGMFGLLPEYLAADGFRVEILRERIEPGHLEPGDTLVTINVNTRWSTEELLTVWRFVRDGGNLLVLGDHTDVAGSQQSQNDLLAPVGIRFNFDSTVPTHFRGWSESDLLFHPIHSSARRASDLGFAVGASLELSSRHALPLAVGRYGLADRGDRRAADRAFLGNYRHDAGEPIGDIILSAWAPLGRGKVLVFGDTSGFQNVPLEGTYDPHVREVFSWISGSTRWDLGANATVATAVGFLALALAGFVAVRAGGRGPAVLALGFALLVSSQSALHAHRLARPPIDLPRALVDVSHAPRIDFRADAPNDLSGLTNNLRRSGYYVDHLQELKESSLRDAHLLFAIAPVIRYSASEVNTLLRFMESGGFVVAAAGYREKAGLQPLLDALGLDVAPQPIGAIPLNRPEGRARVQVEYVDPWPIVFAPSPSSSGESPSSDAPVHSDAGEVDLRVYGAYEDLPLAVLRPVGRGGLFLVSDSYFFGAENLEGTESFSEPNILFLRGLLAELGRRKGEERVR